MIYLIMGVYQLAILLMDTLQLIAQVYFFSFLSFYRLFVSPPMKSLQREIVMISGTGQGIGKELALQFARLGATVICLDINENRNKETASQIVQEGGSAFSFSCDVSSRQEIESVSYEIRKNIGDVTILVNSAGIGLCKPILDYTPIEIENLFRVNVFSQFWTIQEWLPTFIKNGKGHIVAMSSFSSILGITGLVPLSASKFAITGLMEGLMEELRYGDQNANLKLTRVHPFFVSTGTTLRSRVRAPLKASLRTEEVASSIIRSVRREEEVVFPSRGSYCLSRLLVVLPRKASQAILDFLRIEADIALE